MNSARRYPRTLQEAFGPYTSRDVLPMRDPRTSRADRVLGALLATVIGITGAALLAHWAAS